MRFVCTLECVDSEHAQKRSRCDASQRVRLYEPKAAVWIGGSVNRQTQEAEECCDTIDKSKSTRGHKNNTDTLSTVDRIGVQSSDSECLEQPFLMSFVQAGNINSFQH